MDTILVFLLFLIKFYSVLTYGSDWPGSGLPRPENPDWSGPGLPNAENLDWSGPGLPLPENPNWPGSGLPHPETNEEFYRRCVNAIYKECTHQSQFTEQEIENARIYIQNRYYNIPNPAYKPVRPPCKKLHVRKDFKCLTHQERLELIEALKELYRNGEQTRLALYPHAVYWGQAHKFIDFFVIHRWQHNELEKALKKVNPRVNLPYWSAHEEFDQPELGILWDYMGRAGNRESDYCVRDGPFVNVKPCIKRKWINDTHIRWWNSIEHFDALLQNVDQMAGYFLWENNPHFKIHLGVAGSEGQMSVPNAPYDFTFYPYHDWIIEPLFFKWQLQNDQQLVPESYNGGTVYDWEIDRIRPANMTRDRIIYFNVSVLETHQNTFGDLCYVHDVVIEAINEITSNRRKEMPFNYKTMPKPLLQQYFPRFFSGNYGPFDYVSHPVKNCNRQCKPIRHSEDFAATVEGNRLLQRFKYLALLNLREFVIANEQVHRKFTDDMNAGGYCSPYIIS